MSRSRSDLSSASNSETRDEAIEDIDSAEDESFRMWLYLIDASAFDLPVVGGAAKGDDVPTAEEVRGVTSPFGVACFRTFGSDFSGNMCKCRN